MNEGALGMVGTTYRRAGQAGLAYYTLMAPVGQAKAEDVRAAGLQPQVAAAGGVPDAVALHRACGFAESVYLATCNRVEVYFVARGPASVESYRRRVYAYFHRLRGEAPAPFADARGLTAFADEGAVERLFVVSCALDSMVPGEAQVLGQVKAALAAAQASGCAGPTLAQLFAQAFRVAKRVRGDTALGRGRTSMVSLATGLVQERLASAAAPSPCDGVLRPTFVVVGAGPMAEQCGRALGGRGGAALLFVNRTVARAEALAAQYGGRAASLAAFVAAPPPLAAMLTSTASPQPLFGADFLRRLPRGALLVDLSVQRDVDLGAASALGLELWDIDRLQARAASVEASRRVHVAEGRALVDDALNDYRVAQTERSLSQAFRRWRRHNVALLDASFEKLRPRLAAAGPAGEALVPELRRWAHTLLNAATHGPTYGLRRAAHLCGQQAVHAFVDGARLTSAGSDATDLADAGPDVHALAPRLQLPPAAALAADAWSALAAAPARPSHRARRDAPSHATPAAHIAPYPPGPARARDDDEAPR